METEATNREMRIWCADEKQLTPEVAMKPYVLKLEIPVGAEFLEVFNLPNLMSMMGFGNAGGPPGYAFLVNPDEDAMCTRHFVSRVADQPFAWRAEHAQMVHRGLLTVVGVPVLILEVFYSVEGESMQRLEERYRKTIVLLDGVRYRTPPALLKRVAPNAVADEERTSQASSR